VAHLEHRVELLVHHSDRSCLHSPTSLIEAIDLPSQNTFVGSCASPLFDRGTKRHFFDLLAWHPSPCDPNRIVVVTTLSQIMVFSSTTSATTLEGSNHDCIPNRLQQVSDHRQADLEQIALLSDHRKRKTRTTQDLNSKQLCECIQNWLLVSTLYTLRPD
jgi:hypothetical protein